MIRLSVNLNKVALLRNQRAVGYPSVIEFARTVIDAGAHGITVHPRPDERHIRRSDVYDLAELMANDYKGQVEFNIEGNPTPDFMQLVREIRPDQATLVPDDPAQSTSDHGWDPDAPISQPLPGLIAELRELGIRTSLFMDAEPGLIARIHNVGSERIELYTGPWAAAFGTPQQADDLAGFVAAAEKARDLGMGLNAGHDLNLDNLPAFCAAIPWLEELSIGHAITADALRMGFAEAVRAYLRAIDVD